MDRIKLEEVIMDVWQTSKDIDYVMEFVMEDKNFSSDPDRIANALLGLSTIHDLKCQKLQDLFEFLVREGKIK